MSNPKFSKHSGNNPNGFTLLETLVYLALFGIVIGGGLIATYQIIETSQKVQTRIAVSEEGNFIIQKVDSLIGNSTLATSANSNTLTLTDGTNTDTITLAGNKFTLKRDLGANIDISSSYVSAESNGLTNVFTITPNQGPKPASISFTFKLTANNYEQVFTLNRSLRL